MLQRQHSPLWHVAQAKASNAHITFYSPLYSMHWWHHALKMALLALVQVEAFVQLKELCYAGSHGMDISGPQVCPPPSWGFLGPLLLMCRELPNFSLSLCCSTPRSFSFDVVIPPYRHMMGSAAHRHWLHESMSQGGHTAKPATELLGKHVMQAQGWGTCMGMQG